MRCNVKLTVWLYVDDTLNMDQCLIRSAEVGLHVCNAMDNATCGGCCTL